MKKQVKKSSKKVNRWIFWTPRILTIIFILFISLFSLDVFGNNYSLTQLIVGLFMHNVPSFILIILLLISWKYEQVGTIGFALLALGYVFMIKGEPMALLSAYSVIVLPCLVISILFCINYLKKKK